MAEILEENKKTSEKKKNWWQKFKNNKKAVIVATIIVALVIVLSIVGVYFLVIKIKANKEPNLGQVELNEEAVYRIIDGVLTTKDKANLLPVAIVIENYKDVRPQNSLASANVVYEALAEGGITRFLAIYADGTDIKTIGPVRSARHYFVDLAEEYGGIFAHIGGSPQALGVLSFEDYITDLNQFGYSQYYWRDESVPAPHNLFTSSEMMSFAVRDMLSEKTEGDYEPWQFNDEVKMAGRPKEEINIKIDYGLDDYSVEWKYNRENNNYLRFNGGGEHKDKNTDQQITAKNVIIQFTETNLIDSERLDIKTMGEGEALIFFNGQYINGKWKKENRGDRTKFYDAAGKEIQFSRGNSWIEIVKQDTTVEWADKDGVAQKKN